MSRNTDINQSVIVCDNASLHNLTCTCIRKNRNSQISQYSPVLYHVIPIKTLNSLSLIIYNLILENIYQQLVEHSVVHKYLATSFGESFISNKFNSLSIELYYLYVWVEQSSYLGIKVDMFGE